MWKLNSSKMVCRVLLFCATTAIPLSAQAQTFTTLASFNGTNGFGFKPTLVQGTDGNFYGTTGYGGDFTCNITLGMGCGVVFKITPGGMLTTLHTFGGPDGWIPSSGLAQATDANFYGATEGGGSHNNISTCFAGCGTVFKITPAGTLTTLYNFCAQTNCTDGAGPNGLAQATDGNFYGTSSGGGNNGCSGGCGTVFGITPGGKLSTLYNFCAQTNCADGYNPSVLVQATDGNFYGTNSAGGLSNSNCTAGCGTVFRITLGGALTTLHSFDFADGWIPSSLVQGTDGNFYGTTQGGGTNSLGTVFKITPGGTLTTLHSFGGSDGGTPVGPLVQATDGNFYGTTDYGGNLMCNAPHGCGVIFKITPGGALTTLHNFIYADGTNPGGGLVQGTDGNFYGATFQGGNTNLCNTFGCGTVFKLSVGLGPFVETIPTSGAVGTAVIILGNNLTGATGVSFNGTPAAFTVVSSSEIQTIVPAGATTGVVQVTTPSGTLNSNVSFTVLNQVLLDAPSAGGSYYGMYCSTCIAASFTLTASHYVSTIDVVLRTPTTTSFTTFDFSLQNSLTAPITTFASQALTAALGAVSTVTMNVNKTLPAGTYYLVGNVPGYFGTPVTSGDVDGWLLSTGIYNNAAGTVTNGVWGVSGSTWFLGSGVAPAFSVNGGFPATKPVDGDFDGDHKSDIAIWRPSNGTWFVIPSSAPNNAIIQQWGASGDIPVRGDYDSDGKTDLAVWRPSNGVWYIIPSRNPSAVIVKQWGTSGDIPVPGDYDGDGKTDFAVFRPSNGVWYIIPSSNPSAPIVQQWGTQGDVPVPGDYDGDGKTDFAVFRPSTGTWFIIPSSNPATPIVQQWGTNGDIPVPGDYDGDGKTDFAVWRPSSGTWFIIPSSNPGAPIIQQWGTQGDIPVPVDYDGDRKTDIAVWRPSNGTWYIIPSATPGTFTITQWGISSDVPLQKPIGQ